LRKEASFPFYFVFKERSELSMRILVTGGAGFIGSHIVDQCIAMGHAVAVIDNLWEEGGGKEQNLNPKRVSSAQILQTMRHYDRFLMKCVPKS